MAQADRFFTPTLQKIRRKLVSSVFLTFKPQPTHPYLIPMLYRHYDVTKDKRGREKGRRLQQPPWPPEKFLKQRWL